MTSPTSSLLLFQLATRDRVALDWLRRWSRSHITRLKRRRKYLPRGAPFDAQEATILRALIDLDTATGKLLEVDD